jgi:hypothetical protein
MKKLCFVRSRSGVSLVRLLLLVAVVDGLLLGHDLPLLHVDATSRGLDPLVVVAELLLDHTLHLGHLERLLVEDGDRVGLLVLLELAAQVGRDLETVNRAPFFFFFSSVNLVSVELFSTLRVQSTKCKCGTIKFFVGIVSLKAIKK